MADTFTPVRGFLAGFYRAVGLTIGASTVYQPLTNRDFETGDLTGWTDDSAGGSSAVVTTNKGWHLASYGCVLDDDGTNKAGISQTITLDDAASAAQAAIWRLHASCWARFDAAAKEAALRIQCLDALDAPLGAATVTMISKHPVYSPDDDHSVDGFFLVSSITSMVTEKNPSTL